MSDICEKSFFKDPWAARVTACRACNGSGIGRYVRFCDEWEPDRCDVCGGNGQVMIFEPASPLPLGGASRDAQSRRDPLGEGAHATPRPRPNYVEVFS